MESPTEDGAIARPLVEVATELRAKVEAALVPVCKILDEAGDAGFLVTFSIAPDYNRRSQVTNISIVKPF